MVCLFFGSRPWPPPNSICVAICVGKSLSVLKDECSKSRVGRNGGAFSSVHTVFCFPILLSPHIPINHILKSFSNLLLFRITIKSPSILDGICAPSLREDNPVLLQQRSCGSSIIWPKVLGVRLRQRWFLVPRVLGKARKSLLLPEEDCYWFCGGDYFSSGQVSIQTRFCFYSWPLSIGVLSSDTVLCSGRLRWMQY